MDTLCVSFPPVPDDLADWDCGDALADLGNLDSFDFSPEDFADPNSNRPSLTARRASTNGLPNHPVLRAASAQQQADSFGRVGSAFSFTTPAQLW